MGAEAFKAARDFLFAHRTDYRGAHAGFRWPQLEHFNYALDWFDVELARSENASRLRSEEHTSELQSPAMISYAVFCLKKKIAVRMRDSAGRNWSISTTRSTGSTSNWRAARTPAG